MRRVRSKQGASYVELVLVFFVLIVLFLAGVEFGNSIRYSQRLQQMGRELATQAYRECSGLYLEPTCLSSITSRVEILSSGMLPGSGTMVSAYLCESSSTNLPSPLFHALGPNALASSRQSRLPTSGTISGQMSLLCGAHKNGILIGEVFYDYRPIVPMIYSWINQFFTQREFYAVVLY